ncbi:MAG: hypothetical protein LWW94_01745 [Candidatus Desulfofervidaceae bacterium]|nr:hypothetical protein [Candidatus Desulfofervidaceae bacterium]
MRVLDLSQILSHSSMVEKSQESQQRMGEEAQKMFFLNLQKEIIRKDKQIPRAPEGKEIKLEEKEEKKRKRKKEEKKKEKQTKTQDGRIDVKV